MRIVGLLALAAVAVWTYAPALGSYLVTDDFQWIDGGMQFTLQQLFAVADRNHFYRPIIEVYFALMQSISGCSARALHVASLVLHLVNVCLVIRLALILTGNTLFAALSGVLFACQPAPAEAVLWPSAVTTLLCTTFGLLMLILDAERDGAASKWRSGAVVVAFALALGCHESGIMFLPAALLLRFAREQQVSLARLRHYVACAIVLAAYVALTAWINSRNYVVTEGHYTIGPHVLTNLFDYFIALYAGRRRLFEYLLAAAACALLLWKGDRYVRAWAAWMLVALIPVLPFEWGISSRYLYVPAVPFSLLLARGITWLRPIRRPAGIVLTIAATLLVVVRSATFARKGASGFQAQASRYEDVADTMRRQRAGNTITVERSVVDWIAPLYVEPLARVAACDPNVKLNIR